MTEGIHVPLYLAPMDEITDYPFRALCKRHGADFVYTDFIAADSLIRNVDKSIRTLQDTLREENVGVQIFGNNVESLQEAAKIVEKYKPQEININCGCPIHKIVSHGSGAALLKDPERMVKIVKAIVDVVDIPVSVKTRLGSDSKSIIIEELVYELQKVGVAKVIVHARTRAQMYSGDPQWEYLKRIKDNKSITIPIIGNGDVVDYNSAMKMQETGVDGIMIGRGAIGNPWIFNDIKSNNTTQRDLKTIIETVKEHLSLYMSIYDEMKALMLLKKHYHGYFKNMYNAKNIRTRLYSATTMNEVLRLLDSVCIL